jgi:hypothetical protein
MSSACVHARSNNACGLLPQRHTLLVQPGRIGCRGSLLHHGGALLHHGGALHGPWAAVGIAAWLVHGEAHRLPATASAPLTTSHAHVWGGEASLPLQSHTGT